MFPYLNSQVAPKSKILKEIYMFEMLQLLLTNTPTPPQHGKFNRWQMREHAGSDGTRNQNHLCYYLKGQKVALFTVLQPKIGSIKKYAR